MGRPKKDPPLIRSDLFSVPSDLSIDELRALSISSNADLPTFLTAVHWNGGAYATFPLTLSPDNQRVLSGSCVLLGELFSDKSFNCNLFWNPPQPTKLILSIPDLSVFNFPDGKLVSNYLPSSAIPHSFSQSASVLSQDQLTNKGVSPFTLRAFLHPISDEFIKIIILLYPCYEDTLLQLYPLYKDPRFPGLKLCSFDFPLGPPCNASPISRPWGFPILPAIIPGSPLSDLGPFPSGTDLRSALSAILHSAALPEVKQNLQSFNLRCQEILAKGVNSLKFCPPPVLWPAAPGPAAQPIDPAGHLSDNDDSASLTDVDQDTNSLMDNLFNELGHAAVPARLLTDQQLQPTDCVQSTSYTQDAYSNAANLASDSSSGLAGTSSNTVTLDPNVQHFLDIFRTSPGLPVSNISTIPAVSRPNPTTVSRPTVNLPSQPNSSQSNPSQLALIQALSKVTAKKPSKSKKSKKKKKKSSHSASSSSSESANSSSDSSSSEDDGSNWSLLRTVWPVEKRPPGLQNKDAFNAIDLVNLLSIAKLERENLKALDGDLTSSFIPDRKPKSTSFKSAKDNGFQHLHEARFLRYPLAKIDKWWKLVPKVRSHQYKNLPLKFSGSNNKLTQKTIQGLHDRTKSLQFKHFHSANVNVSTKPVKKIEKREEEGIVSTLDYAWENPTSISQVANTLLNYTTALLHIWPYDQTGLILMRVVNKFNYASAAPSLSDRVAIITAFFNLVLRENATRAVRRDLIMDYDEQVEAFKNILTSSGFSSSTPSSFRIPKVGSDGFKPRPTINNLSRSNSSTGTLKPKINVVLHNNVPICFNYNSGSCRNPQSTPGCRDPKSGKDYAHVCNRWVQAKNSHCFARHPRINRP